MERLAANPEETEAQFDRVQAVAPMARIRARAATLKISFDWNECKKERDAGRP